MQVSQAELANTHAVIGGGEARAFQMSQTAEFFTILSDTLYRDKILAFVREIICNAWDAHIVAGKEGVPIEIELTKNEVVFRDFGPGISDDKIAENYCTYGNSTKANDDDQTGGFGLGSKAPFAYSDHFTVVSCFEGVKTVYAISRGGIETGGIPDIRDMMTVETEETGLTVRIPIKSDDLGEISHNIWNVVYGGGINATLNGDKLPTLDVKNMEKSGFALFARQNLHLRDHPLYVKYGSVIYPVESETKAIQNAKNKIQGLLGAILRNNGSLVLCAKPGSIGITPSREALSYGDATVDEINKMVNEFVDKVESHSDIGDRTVAQKLLSASEDPADALDKISNPFDTGSVEDLIPRTSDYAEAAALINYKNQRGLNRMLGIAAKKLHAENRGVFKKVIAHPYKELGGHDLPKELSGRLCSSSLRLISKFARRAEIESDIRLARREGAKASQIKFYKMSDAAARGYMDRPVEKVLIISQSQVEASLVVKSITDELPSHKRSSVLFATVSVPRNKAKERDRISERAEQLGYDVKVVETPSAPKKKKVVKTEKKVLYHNAANTFSRSDIFEEECRNAPRQISDPKVYVRSKLLKSRAERAFTYTRRGYALSTLAYMIGDMAIVFSDLEEKRIRQAGAISLNEWLTAEEKSVSGKFYKMAAASLRMFKKLDSLDWRANKTAEYEASPVVAKVSHLFRSDPRMSSIFIKRRLSGNDLIEYQNACLLLRAIEDLKRTDEFGERPDTDFISKMSRRVTSHLYEPWEIHNLFSGIEVIDSPVKYEDCATVDLIAKTLKSKNSKARK